MIPIFMVFAGGPLGSRKQWFSWIHVDDLVSLIYEALVNPNYRGQASLMPKQELLKMITLSSLFHGMTMNGDTAPVWLI
ncbi:epimerase family protein SDR39U1 homolog, chloroplastic-like [Apium graveolens]|uniref:epimerase family protein SDR39U1 homolog, chloroplastic-like n=1 Tax=Apium graveolens TaxID=4045 RepID=UPI003D794E94